MVKLVHEIWQMTDDRGRMLSALSLAGPDGEPFRRMLRHEHEDATCVHKFEAESHFEAMTIYYRHLGRGEYSSEFPMDREPYPHEWALRQQRGTN